MEIGPVLRDAGTHPCEDAHVTDAQYYGRRALSTKSTVEVDSAVPRTRRRAGDESQPARSGGSDGRGQAGRTLLTASDITVAAPWQNEAWAVVPMMPRLVR